MNMDEYRAWQKELAQKNARPQDPFESKCFARFVFDRIKDRNFSAADLREMSAKFLSQSLEGAEGTNPVYCGELGRLLNEEAKLAEAKEVRLEAGATQAAEPEQAGPHGRSGGTDTCAVREEPVQG